MTEKSQFAWAIDSNSAEGHGFLGRYWRFRNHPVPVMNGVLRTRLFETRQEARDAVKDMKSRSYVCFPKAAVRKVEVIVREVKT